MTNILPADCDHGVPLEEPCKACEALMLYLWNIKIYNAKSDEELKWLAGELKED